MPASLWLSEELEPRPLYLKALTEPQPPLPPAQASPAQARRLGSTEEEAAYLSWAAAAFRWQNKAGFAAWLLSCHIILLPVPTCLASEPQPAPSTWARKTDRAPLPVCASPPLPGGRPRHQQPRFWVLSPVHRGARRGERRGRHSSAKTCGFILRTHHAAFTQCPDWEIGRADAWSCRQGRGFTLGFSLYRFARANGLHRVFLPAWSLAPKPPRPPCVCVPRRQVCRDFQIQNNSSPQMPGTLNIYRQQFARVHLMNGH